MHPIIWILLILAAAAAGGGCGFLYRKNVFLKV